MEIIHKKERNDAHPYIPELKELYRGGRISRREFLRNATLLGMSLAGASTFLAACAQEEATEAPTEPPDTSAPEATAPPEAEEPTGPRRGGTLRVAARVQKVGHPATFSWIMQSNVVRQVAEYLTVTDRENITHPYLLESWDASDDLQTWTLNLRQGITFNNGDDFGADDVVFTMQEWLNEDVGSSILGLMGYLSADNIEKVDDYTVRLHLDRPEIAVPEHLFHYPSVILNHRTFEGDFLKAPHGTGPYVVEEYNEGDRALLKRRSDYWQNGADGEPLPYLDEMEFIEMGEDISAWIAAIQSGEVDYLDLGDENPLDAYLTLRENPEINVVPVPTAQCRVLRMRADLEPWSDNRVRQALKLCQNREKLINLSQFGEAFAGHDAHVCPVHPEYCEKPIQDYDPEKAKQLLADAGYPDGLDVEIGVNAGVTDFVTMAEILKEDAAPAGFNISISTMPASQYWEQWTELSLGITPWTHRPLGTMVLNLAYTVDQNGDPVPWNETRWVDEEFIDLLQEANGTLDVEKRRELFCELEQIQMDRGSIGIAFWRNIWFMARDSVKNMEGHPTYYMLFNEVWKEA